MIEKTFYEIIKEAKNGQVEIDNDKYYYRRLRLLDEAVLEGTTL